MTTFHRYSVCLFLACLLLIAGCGGGGDDSPAPVIPDGGGANNPLPAGPVNRAPTANFTVTPSAGDAATVFQFDASGSADPEDAADTLEVSWDFDGNGVWTDWTRTKTASHSYPALGTKAPKLRVRDSAGMTGEVSRTFVVSPVVVVPVNQTPDAQFSVEPAAGDTNTTFQFDASQSADADDAPATLLVRWEFENDGIWTDWTTARTAAHRFTAAGDKTVRLQVKDPDGLTGEMSRTFPVSPFVAPPPVNQAPTARLAVSATTGRPDTVFQFDASGSTDPEDAADTLEVSWDFEGNGAWTAWTRARTVSHTFAGLGAKSPRVRVRDSAGMEGATPASVSITLSQPPLSAIAAVPDGATYAPGQPLQMRIFVQPDSGTSVYAVEDSVPAGWVVSSISHDGAFDAVNNKVKWGPFFDNAARALTYTATPPANASAPVTFAGTVSFDGQNASIEGVRTLSAR